MQPYQVGNKNINIENQKSIQLSFNKNFKKPFSIQPDVQVSISSFSSVILTACF